MEKETLKMELERIEKNYGADKFVMDQGLFDLWYEVVGDSREDVFHDAVNECLKKNAYAPNIAGVMIYYDELMKMHEERRKALRKDLFNLLADWGQERTLTVIEAWINYCKRESEENMIEESHKLANDANNFMIACKVKGEKLPPLEKYIEGKYGC